MAKEVPIHKRPDVCKPHSCKLQKCLYETNYQMFRCQHHLDHMIDCCRHWRDQAFSCEGFMWMFKDQFQDKLDNQQNTDQNSNKDK